MSKFLFVLSNTLFLTGLLMQTSWSRWRFTRRLSRNKNILHGVLFQLFLFREIYLIYISCRFNVFTKVSRPFFDHGYDKNRFLAGRSFPPLIFEKMSTKQDEIYVSFSLSDGVYRRFIGSTNKYIDHVVLPMWTCVVFFSLRILSCI